MSTFWLKAISHHVSEIVVTVPVSYGGKSSIIYLRTIRPLCMVVRQHLHCTGIRPKR